MSMNMLSFVSSIQGVYGEFGMRISAKKISTSYYRLQSMSSLSMHSTNLLSQEKASSIINQRKGIHGTYYTTNSGKSKFIPDAGSTGNMIVEKKELRISGTFHPATKSTERVATFTPVPADFGDMESLLKGKSDVRGNFLVSGSKEDESFSKAIAGVWNLVGKEAIFLPDRAGVTGQLYVIRKGDQKTSTHSSSSSSDSKTSKLSVKMSVSSTTQVGVFGDSSVTKNSVESATSSSTTSSSIPASNGAIQGGAYTSLTKSTVFVPTGTGTKGYFKLTVDSTTAQPRVYGTLHNTADGKTATFVTSTISKLLSTLQEAAEATGVFVPSGSLETTGIPGTMSADPHGSSGVFTPDTPPRYGAMMPPSAATEGQGVPATMYGSETSESSAGSSGQQSSRVHGLFYKGTSSLFLPDFPLTKGNFIPTKSGPMVHGTFSTARAEMGEIFMPDNPEILASTLSDATVSIEGRFKPDDEENRGDGFVEGYLKQGSSANSYDFIPKSPGASGWISMVKVESKGMSGRSLDSGKYKLCLYDTQVDYLWTIK